MRNASTANRRAPTPLIITALLALAAILSIMSAVPAAVHAQTTVDYDTDDDGYIEVSTLAQLNVIRRDLNGNGDPTSAGATAYGTAFPNRDTNAATRMGCPSGACVGYELTANLTFDENGDGSITAAGDPTYWNANAGWDPIGTSTAGYSGDFKGNRYTIDYLYVDRQTVNGVGLFARIEATSRVESLGLTNADVKGNSYAGALVGQQFGTVVGCYSTGSVLIDSGGDGAVGGLVGWLATVTSPLLASSYSTASTSGHTNGGGLVGAMQSGEIRHSYATGAVTRSSGTLTTFGGLVGGSTGTVTASYYDSTTTGCVSGSTTGCTGSAGGTARTTAQLQSPTDYTGIYAAWNANLDDVPGNDYPWDFGTASQYPTLTYGTPGDYDISQNNLIEITNLAQLNAIRYDLDGNGAQGAVSASDWMNYTAAFPDALTGMGCASTCVGYELFANLNFDENADGSITSADAAYWDSGSGWEPIGTGSAPYATTFNGNGYVIDSLFISRSTAADVGLFGAIGSAARVESVGVRNANVTGANQTGILTGRNAGAIVAAFTTGAATGTTSVGGMAGLVQGATASVLSSYSTASASGTAQVGGLIGRLHSGTVTDTYAVGAVSLSGGSATTIGGLIGEAVTAGGVSRSYWDTTTSGQTASAGGSGVEGKTTTELQTPTAYGATSSDIYFGWNANIDGSPGNDDPWDFGTTTEYPLLKFGGHNAPAQGRGDYDKDDDGYIDVSNLAQLNAIRHDLNGDGDPSAVGSSILFPTADSQATLTTATTAYNAAFPGRETGAAFRMGCPSGACVGYELTTNLDFDENGDGQITAADSTYWDGGKGWLAISGFAVAPQNTRYSGNFKGNGYTINNLFIDRPGSTDNSRTTRVGLFGNTHNSRIESLGVTNANIKGDQYVGAIVGRMHGGSIVACYSTGRVEGSNINDNGAAAGIVGWINGASISSSYSHASAHGKLSVGGLVGRMNGGSITNSYSIGSVIRTDGSSFAFGGLVGWIDSGSLTNTYWNTQTSGRTNVRGNTNGTLTNVVGKTTRQLQTPTAYTGSIYSAWDANLDGQPGNDDPWDFGNNTQYPMLKYKGMSTAPQGGQAMGVPDNWNAPVVGERINVRLSPDDFPNRAIVQGTQYREPWGWEKSANGYAWTNIPGTGDGSKLPSYEYSPTAADVGSYIRAKVKLDDGSFARTRALGGRVIADTGAAISGTTAGDAIPFIDGHIAPYVGGAAEVVAANPLPAGAVDVRIGWQRCEDNIAPHSDCESVPGVWWIRYKPTAADAGKYLRMYAYYEDSAGVWTRSVTDFTVGVVATVSP